MTTPRRIRRQQCREAEKNFSVLGELLMGFYEFLEQPTKPSDEEVRNEFIKREQAWKRHCTQRGLTEEAKLMFNSEVSQSWEARYAKREN